MLCYAMVYKMQNQLGVTVKCSDSCFDCVSAINKKQENYIYAIK